MQSLQDDSHMLQHNSQIHEAGETLNVRLMWSDYLEEEPHRHQGDIQDKEETVGS